MIEQTLILLKPDAVKRCLVGECIKRFEQKGIRIAGMKLIWADEDLASKHYGDLDIRRGKDVKKRMVNFLTEGPVVALVLEGAEAVEVVRKIVGPTEPKTAPPGTIRGDYAHVSFAHADEQDKGVMNLIHASGSKEEAKQEIELWFKEEELHSYDLVNKAYAL